MNTMDCRPRLPQWLLPLLLPALFAACASAPLAEDPRSPTVVTRTASTTVWATPEALAAAQAAEQAARAARATAAAPAAAKPTPPAASVARAPTPPPAPVPGPAQVPTDFVLGPAARLVHFEFDRFDVAEGYQWLIEGHARRLRTEPALRLVVEGHADERGGAEYNLALGQKRAEAVLKALALLGVAGAQVEAVSFGDTRPVDAGRNEEAWARNRRAEVKDR